MRCDAVDLNFIRGQFTEAELESAIISLLSEQGYDYVPGDTIHRGFEEILIKEDLRSYLFTISTPQNFIPANRWSVCSAWMPPQSTCKSAKRWKAAL